MAWELPSWTTFSLFLCSALKLFPFSSANLTGNGLTVVLSNVDYFISPYTAGRIGTQDRALSSGNLHRIYGFTPVTVVQDAISEAELGSLFANWIAYDDVFQDGFTQAVLLRSPVQPYKLRGSNNHSMMYQVYPLNVTIPSGPYFLEAATGALHQVYRLYDDFAGSFTTPLLQTPQGSFQHLSAQVAASATMTVGVPSRLYFTKTAEKPLAGVRVAVKVRSRNK